MILRSSENLRKSVYTVRKVKAPDLDTVGIS